MVNTFIVSSDIYESMETLDFKRLGKTRLEAKQIINVLENELNGGWSKHPATLSFVGYIDALKAYYNICVQEWISRGYKNTMKLYDVDESRFSARFFDKETKEFSKKTKYSYPKFVSFEPYLLAHKAALFRKDNEYYKDFEVPEEYLERGYLWPCNYSDEIYKNWDLKYLSEIGTGAPARYRISKEEVKIWELNKNINPKTKRKITEKGGIYKDYLKASIYWNSY